MATTVEQERTWNVLVYGLEKVGLTAPLESIKGRNFTIHFEKYRTPRRLNEFDCVVIFQGIFEEFEQKTNYHRAYLTHEYDQDELDKRKKEASLLLNNGGVLAFVLNRPFIDHDDRRDFKATDLAKFHLNYPNFYRENYSRRVAHVEPCVSEFKGFLDIYGAGHAQFRNFNNGLEILPIARCSNETVGMIIDRQQYFIPSLVPDNRQEVLSEYFDLLVGAITSFSNKLHQRVPEWISSFKFQEENQLEVERDNHMAEVARIDARIDLLTSYKAALVHTGHALVQDVSAALSAALGVTVDTTDEFREDATLLDQDGKQICVCEIKGINRGVGREHINQTDSHRERSGHGEDFPALLVANTLIKSARTIEEKYQDIAPEQVRHAAKVRVLILRTIDLLDLLRLVLADEISKEEALSLVLGNSGWLRVAGNRVEIMNGQ